MELTKESLEQKFNERSLEIQQMELQRQELSEQLNNVETLIKEGVGELKGYKKLYQEFFEGEEELNIGVVPDEEWPETEES